MRGDVGVEFGAGGRGGVEDAADGGGALGGEEGGGSGGLLGERGGGGFAVVGVHHWERGGGGRGFEEDAGLALVFAGVCRAGGVALDNGGGGGAELGFGVFGAVEGVLAVAAAAVADAAAEQPAEQRWLLACLLLLLSPLVASWRARRASFCGERVGVLLGLGLGPGLEGVGALVALGFGGEVGLRGGAAGGADEELDLLDEGVHAAAADELAAAREGGRVAEGDIGGLVFVGLAEEDALGGDGRDDAGDGRAGGRGLEGAGAGAAGVGDAGAGGGRRGGRGEDGRERLGGVGDERHCGGRPVESERGREGGGAEGGYMRYMRELPAGRGNTSWCRQCQRRVQAGPPASSGLPSSGQLAADSFIHAAASSRCIHRMPAPLLCSGCSTYMYARVVPTRRCDSPSRPACARGSACPSGPPTLAPPRLWVSRVFLCDDR